MKLAHELKITDIRWEGYTLWKYIKLHFPYYTKLLIIKELRLKHILLNDESTYFQYKLKFGDTIKIFLLPDLSEIGKKRVNRAKLLDREEFKAETIKFQIVFENNDVIIINKKATQIVQPDSSSSNYSLEELLQSYLKKKDPDSTYKPKFIHRLDKPVEGLIIGAKNAQAHSVLSQAIKDRKIQKFYKAIVLGCFPYREKQLENWILDKQSKVKVLDQENHGTKYSISIVRGIKKFPNYSIVEIKLVTGRKNQIRAQLSHLGYPIVGDRKYFNRDLKKKVREVDIKWKKLFLSSEAIALFSYKLIFDEQLVEALSLGKNTFELNQNPKKWDFWIKNLH
ncbi:RluA family pseudouridine synthase [Mycoplasma suis]|uniref:RNA pseudouridylate synthase n=2 Tax=Mycoplasma suis TaxID=57372 RepID=F0QQS3_MYCSL|nr:RluA family pseudouridine synthase [Mycoplasma suis]ADX97843.1 tRNA pseudouridine synthase [Mycoplasma suis str. Illinois]CBZ40343.1 probable pseudouridine synthase [Mycoplasma suis KI3806]